ncbi:protein of unknown function [Pseudomonas mediterranea]
MPQLKLVNSQLNHTTLAVAGDFQQLSVTAQLQAVIEA